ncbi:ATPase, T2SS/T4P/T4SS family, partial [Gemmatimonadota bacterium]
CLDPPDTITELWQRTAEQSGVTLDELADIVARYANLKQADLNSCDDLALRFLPEKLARQYHVFPIREDHETLVVATCAPFDLDLSQVIRFASGRTPILEVAPPEILLEKIEARYSPDRIVEGLLGDMAAYGEDVTVLGEQSSEDIGVADIEAEPVIKLTSAIMRDAILQGASDVHIEPSRIGGVVRFRVDGVMRHYMQMPIPALTRIVSRFKILSKLDIADRLRPQDGRATVRIRGRSYDMRISTVPTRISEKMVIRILDPGAAVTLDRIGVMPAELKEFRQLLSRRDSIVIITGPTGSGKTTTFYSALRELATESVNIITVEDPIEYELDSITQIQVEPEQGVTFASALRAVLRQDPDIIMIGEIRDEETASIAIQASLTGHLVLATMHTNDSVGVITRLTDLGLDPTAIAESLRGALAQRLLRKLCRECAERILEEDLTPDERAQTAPYGVVPIYRAKGCARCGNTGYRDRFAVMELWSSSAELEELIARRATISELRQAIAAGGMKTLLEAALEKVTDGTTTLDEVERVLGIGGENLTAPVSPVAEITVEAPGLRSTGESSVDPDESENTIQTEMQELYRGALALVVDDDAVNRRLGRTLLEKNGFQVAEAEDGRAAIELLKLEPEFNLLVLDLDMPHASGEDVLRAVRGSVSTAGIPVIILTGSEEHDTEARLMEAGADDYIRKPLNPPTFMARVNAVLRRAGT